MRSSKLNMLPAIALVTQGACALVPPIAPLETVTADETAVITVCPDLNGICKWSQSKGWSYIWRVPPALPPLRDFEILRSGHFVASAGTGAGNDWLAVISPDGQSQLFMELQSGMGPLSSHYVELPDGSILLEASRRSGFSFLTTDGSAPPPWLLDRPAGCSTLRIAQENTPVCLAWPDETEHFSIWAYDGGSWREQAAAKVDLPEKADLRRPDEALALERGAMLLLDLERVLILSARGVKVLGDGALWAGVVNGRVLISYRQCDEGVSCRSEVYEVGSGGMQSRLELTIPAGELWRIRAAGSNRWVLEMSTTSGRLLLLARQTTSGWETEELWAEDAGPTSAD